MSINNEVTIINETSKKDKSELWCQLCNYLLITSEDVMCSEKHSCCEECWLTFGQKNRKLWKEGWRPDSETLNRYKQSRRIINIDIMKILGE